MPHDKLCPACNLARCVGHGFGLQDLLLALGAGTIFLRSFCQMMGQRPRHGNRSAIEVVALVAIWVAWRMRRALPRGVPFADGPWFLRNVLDFARAASQKKQLARAVELHEKFGSTFVIGFPLTPWIVTTTNPAIVNHILKTNFQNYPKGPWMSGNLVELLGQGIFNTDGQNWLHQRKTASKMFTATLFREHIWVVVRRNARKLRDILESSAADPEGTVDVFNLMNRFTLDTIGEIGFGKCIGSLENPSSPFLRSFDRAQQIAFQRFYIPIWPLLRRLGLGPERDTREHFHRLDEYSRTVVQELRSSLTRSSAKVDGVAWADIEGRKSFLGLFLEDAGKHGEDLSEDFLRDLVLNFLIAGRDTTAQAISWAVYCLSTHPEVQAKARQEVNEVCGIRGPSYDDLQSLPYLQAVLNEVLRLYPSVPFDLKTAAQSDTWPDGTFVPKGTIVAYDIYAMGQDFSIWGDDAKVFRPERWLEMKEPPDSYSYPVFNAGPRECLGKRLALVEMKACLATLLPHLSFKLAVPAEEVKPDASITIGMGSGLPCYVVRIAEKQDASSGASATTQSECATTLSEITRDTSDIEEA
mmetsp:Transcript_34424/g.73303  ORF Transcript_34424/g.73303 Transcript_34424/m.73303 type:complete len:584 (+) Transcript_34424:80-1831(+)